MNSKFFADTSFQGGQVEVDNTTFTRCHFIRCQILYSATGPVTFNDCTFHECDWTFEGAAESTLYFLSALYRGLGGGGREVVETIFQAIRDGRVGQGLVAFDTLKAR